MASITDEEAMHSLAIFRERMKGYKTLFSCGGDNDGLHRAVIFSSWLHVDRVVNVLLDTDADFGTNQRLSVDPREEANRAPLNFL